MRKPALVLLAVVALLTLAACGGDADSGDSGQRAEFNSADVSFAQEMIPHHQQAVQMAQMAQTHASSRDVKQLAADIERAQGPEIEQMSEWLKAWGEDVPEASMSHDDMGHGDASDAMPGMMDAEQLSDLQRASGAEWDRMFLTSMIEHHEGAIEMAQEEQADGENPEALALAEQIEEDQRAEVAEMQDLLRR